MEALKEQLAALKDVIKTELIGIKRLQGEQLERFKEVFNIQGEVRLYYNKYCLVIVDTELFYQLQPFLPDADCLFHFYCHDHNVNIRAYNYFNQRILNDYLQ